MNRRFLVSILGGLALSTLAGATTPDPTGSSYKSIVTRNLFGLKPIQTPAPPVAAPPAAAKLTLTGITTLGGQKLALLKAQLPPTPGVAAKEQPLMLTEGQRDGEIEVVEIDEKAGSVRLKNSGTFITLTFEKDGVKTPGGASPPPP